MTSTDDILKKYGAKIERQMGGHDSSYTAQKEFSQSYTKFREAMSPEFSRYEKWCKTLGNLIKLRVGEKDKARISRSIEVAHLDLVPSEVVVLSVVVLFGTLFGGILLIVAGWLLLEPQGFPLMLLFLVFTLSIFLFFYSILIFLSFH